MPDKELIDYIDKPLVYLEIVDRRLTLEPYGPRYPKAIGRIFRLVPGGAPPISDSEADVAFIQELTLPPWEFGQKNIFVQDLLGEVVPVKVHFRPPSILNYPAELLWGEVNYEWPNRMVDLKGLHGRKIALWVIRESMERFTLEYYQKAGKSKNPS